MSLIPVDKFEIAIILREPNKPFSKVLPLPKILRLPADPAASASRVCAMWKLFAEIVTSKKAIATRAGVVLVATNRFGLQLPEDAVTQIIGAIAAYVVSQGLADFGKNAAV